MDEKKSSRGGRRSWGYRFKFSTTPTRVHFGLPEKPFIHPDTGDEMPFRTGSRYWIPKGGAKGNGCYIEQGPECIVDVYKNPKNFGLDLAPISNFQKYDPKVYYSVWGWVEEWFHDVQNNEDGRQWRSKERCEGPGCKWCKDGAPKVFGKKVYFDIAPTHWNESIFAAQETEAQCNCQCGGFTHISYYVCAKCKTPLVDVTQQCYSCKSSNIGIDPVGKEAVCQDCNSEWSVLESGNPEISKVVNDDLKCHSCGHNDLPEPVFECTQCETPNPFGIFDCQMKISMVESKDGKAKELKVEQVLVQEPDSRLFDPQFQGQDGERAEKNAKWNKSPLDLEKLLSAAEPEEEARLLNVANPFVSTAASRGHRDYSRHQESDGDQQESAPEETEPEAQPPKVPNRGRTVIGRR